MKFPRTCLHNFLTYNSTKYSSHWVQDSSRTTCKKPQQLLIKPILYLVINCCFIDRSSKLHKLLNILAKTSTREAPKFFPKFIQS
uniref:Uncharacterized protein n=1 Tax=Arundo donax TaxID=35708 RepID=A0A0A9E1S6_ARUDO